MEAITSPSSSIKKNSKLVLLVYPLIQSLSQTKSHFPISFNLLLRLPPFPFFLNPSYLLETTKALQRGTPLEPIRHSPPPPPSFSPSFSRLVFLAASCFCKRVHGISFRLASEEVFCEMVFLFDPVVP